MSRSKACATSARCGATPAGAARRRSGWRARISPTRTALPYLDQLDVDVLTIEGAFNRGMDFEHVGKMISKDKKIAVGVISHRTLQVERPEEIADLIRTRT